MKLHHIHKGLARIKELWKEYYVRKNGGPALRLLELDYGIKWRNGKHNYDRTAWNKRFTIYQEVEAMITDESYKDTAVSQ